jgi:hypothetical protein
MLYSVSSSHVGAIQNYPHLGTNGERKDQLEGSTHVSRPLPLVVIPLHADVCCSYWKTYKFMDPGRCFGLSDPVW